MKKLLLLLSLVLLAGCGSLDDSIWTPRPVEIDLDAAAPVVADGNFTPGTFTGVGTGGFYGNIHVAVTFSETAITDIEVVYHVETPLFAYPAFERLTADMLRLQTHNVDVLANATMTSEAFIEAVREAIAQSADGAPAPPPPPPPTPEPAGEPDEDDLEEDDLEGQDADEEPQPDTTPDVAAAGFSPGTFTGSGEGYYGPITVSVTFDETSIVSINIVDHEDTPMFVDMVTGVVPPAIIATQSTNVDNVTGATATSLGIRNAVDDAIQQASN